MFPANSQPERETAPDWRHVALRIVLVLILMGAALAVGTWIVSRRHARSAMELNFQDRPARLDHVAKRWTPLAESEARLALRGAERRVSETGRGR